MPCIKPPTGTHVVHEAGVEDSDYTLNYEILKWTDQMLYAWNEERQRFEREDPGPPPVTYLVYFLEPNMWVELDPTTLDVKGGTFDP